MDSLLLTREKLDEIWKSNVFDKWLNGELDEKNITDKERLIITSRQIYFDLLIPDESIETMMDHFRIHDFDELLSNQVIISFVTKAYKFSFEDLKNKVLLMKKRQEKEKTLRLKEDL